MTIEEALALLERHRITRDICDATCLMLNHDDGICEQIGEILTPSRAIYLAEYIPSKIGMTYRDVQKSLTLLDSQRAVFRLQSILDGLPDTAQRYDEAIRKEKVKIVQRYFLKRNTKIKILSPDVDIPDPPDEGTLYFR
jgi:hypothetical protein